MLFAVIAFAIPVGTLSYWTFRDWKEDNLAGFVALLSFVFSAASIALGWLVGSWARREFRPDAN